MDLEGSSRGLICGIIPVFEWRTQENHDNSQSGHPVKSVREELRKLSQQFYVTFGFGEQMWRDNEKEQVNIPLYSAFTEMNISPIVC